MKLSVIPLALLLFFAFSVKSQTEKSKTRKFSFGANFSPDYSYRRLHSNNANYDFLINQLNNWEVPAFGYSTGLSFRYIVFKRFELESGLQFSDKTFNLDIDKDDFEIPDNGSYQQDDPAIPERVITNYHFYYLGVPFKLNYYFIQKRIRMYLMSGVSMDFSLGTKSKTTIKYSDKTETIEHDNNGGDSNKINLTGLAGIGAETALYKRIGIRIEPVFRYSFAPIDDFMAKENLYSAGINLVLFY